MCRQFSAEYLPRSVADILLQRLPRIALANALGKIGDNVPIWMYEKLVGGFSFLARKVLNKQVATQNRRKISHWVSLLKTHQYVELLVVDYVSVLDQERKRQVETAAKKEHRKRSGIDVGLEHDKERKYRHVSDIINKANAVTKACQVLESYGTSTPNLDTYEKIVGKTPPPRDALLFGEAESFVSGFSENAHDKIFFSPLLVSKAILKTMNASSQDLFGNRFEHTKQMLAHGHQESGANLFLAFYTFALERCVRLPGDSFDFLSAAKSIAIAKKEPGDIRPIGITSCTRRIFGKYVMASAGPLMRDILRGRAKHPQYAVAVPGGTSILGLETNIKRVAHPSFVSVGVDCENAFNTVERNAVFRALNEFRSKAGKDHESILDMFAAFTISLYGQGEQDLSFFFDDGERKIVKCGTGVTQGCPLGTALFVLVIDSIVGKMFEEDALKEIPKFPNVSSGWFADDGVLSGPLSEIIPFCNLLKERLASDANLNIKCFNVLDGERTPKLCSSVSLRV